MRNAVTEQTPLVSVIVATYRRCEHLEQALRSLAEQTYKNVEVILVDDNGDAQWNEKVRAVVERIRNYADMEIRYVCNETNMGSSVTRNQGIRLARGTYITFLDDDDIYLPEKIDRQLEAMLSKQAEYSITDLYLYNEQGQLIDKRVRFYIDGTDVAALIRNHLMYHMTGTDTLMFEAEYLRKIGGFSGIDVGDEFYLMKEAILGGGKFLYVNHCYVKAFVHTGEGGGLSSGQGKIDGENALFEEKKKYFSYLTKSEIRFVRMRHYAVLAFAELRRRRLIRSVGHVVLAFLATPRGFARMVLTSR